MKKSTLFLLALAAVGLLVLPLYLKGYGVYLLSYWLVFVVATMGLNLTVGYAGQKSLGHAAFFGIGAYTVAIAMKAGISFWFGLPAAALICSASATCSWPVKLMVAAVWMPSRPGWPSATSGSCSRWMASMPAISVACAFATLKPWPWGPATT